MSSAETSITVSSHDCEIACLKSIEREQAQIDLAWEARVFQEMNRKPFLWIFGGPAKTKDEAIARIKTDFNAHDIGASFREPGMMNDYHITQIKTILRMCRCSDSITLTERDYHLIGRDLPRTSDRTYRT